MMKKGTVGGGCVTFVAFFVSEPLVGTIVFIIGGVLFIWFSSRWIVMAYPQHSLKSIFGPEDLLVKMQTPSSLGHFWAVKLIRYIDFGRGI